MKLNELIKDFTIYTTNEEKLLLEQLSDKPIKISSLLEREQILVQNLIRKSLVTKIGYNDPSVKINVSLQDN